MSELVLSSSEFSGAGLARSPNFGERPETAKVDMLILHYTGMPDDEQALAWLQNPKSQVSCHYFVHKNGQILQLVSEAARAWHAGVSCWKNVDDINSCSIGIEIANPGHNHGYEAFPKTQVEAVVRLCNDIICRHEIRPERVLAHSDIAPERKEDPGELFPWDEFSEAGIGHFQIAAPIEDGRFFQLGDQGKPVAALQAMFSLYGYDCPQTADFCKKTQAIVVAFQRHFRQERVDGVADQSTIVTLHQLLQALPSFD